MLVLIVTVVEVLCGAFTLILCHLAARGTLRRNQIAGIRIPSTLASDAAWREGHRAGRSAAVVITGMTVVAAVAIGAAGGFNLDQGLDLTVAIFWVIIWSLVYGVGISVVAGRAAKRV